MSEVEKERIFLGRVQKLIMTIDDKIRDRKL